MRDILRDFRFGARLLARSPGYAAVVVLTLGLAIGANTTIFSFADLFLISPLPVGDPSRAVFVFSADATRGIARGRSSLADFLDWRAEAASFDQMAASRDTAFTLTGSGEPLRVAAKQATANLLSMWQLAPVEGRLFLPGEDAPGAPKVAVLSHRFWREHFASDPAVVGRPITLNGEPYTVVGVLTPAIEIGNLQLVDVWVPMTIAPAGTRRDDRALAVAAHLKPGVPLDQASAEMRAIGRRLEQAYPQTNAGWSPEVLSVRSSIAGPQAWIILALLSIVVVAVFLVACANVANMMLARASARAREMAVRLALGASRARLVRQLVSESLLLGLTGGALGVGVAYGGIRAIQVTSHEPFYDLLSVNAHLLAFALALSVLGPVLFSVLPALHASRADVNAALKSGGRRAFGGGKGGRSRAALVVAQLALALMLLVVAGLIARTIGEMERTPTGINPAGVLTLNVQLDPPTYRDAAQAARFGGELVDRLAALPGVRAAAAADRLPLLDGERSVPFRVDGRPAPAPNQNPWADAVSIDGGYLQAFGVHLDEGRAFTRHDDGQAPGVALLNRAAVRLYWNGASPVGAHLEIGGADAARERVEIVGVVSDVRTEDPTTPAPPRIYRPLAQSPERALSLVLRVDGDPAAIAGSVRASVRGADPDLAVSAIRPLSSLLDDRFAENRVLVGLFASFALVALALAGTGLYGVTAYAVVQRKPEIGIRIALGATRADVLRLVLGQNARLVAIGAVAGTAGGLALGRALRSVLYKVGASDPATFALVLAVLGLVTLVASYVPARRATTVDPLDCLRSD